jgi:hypothetical protein
MIARCLKTAMSAFLKVGATLCIVSAALAVGGQQQKLPTSAADAQTSSKPIFTDYPPFLCVGGGFVAMAGINRRAPLIVIAIDANGIEAPQTITSVGDAVFGMRCSGSHIELLVNDYKSGRFLILLYTVRQHSQDLTTIREEQREDPEDLNLPTSIPTPPAAEHRRDSFDWVGSRAGAHMRGDWYVWVPQVVNRPNNTYDVHFVSTDKGDVAKLTVTLLEETLDKKKITKSVPLVHIEAPEVND